MYQGSIESAGEANEDLGSAQSLSGGLTSAEHEFWSMVELTVHVSLLLCGVMESAKPELQRRLLRG
jgi:hypothetical protein